MHQVDAFCALVPQGPPEPALDGEGTEEPLVTPERAELDSSPGKAVVEVPAWMKLEDAVAAAQRKRGREEDRMEVNGITEAVRGLASEHESSDFERAEPKDAMELETEGDGFTKRSVDPATVKTSL